MCPCHMADPVRDTGDAVVNPVVTVAAFLGTLLAVEGVVYCSRRLSHWAFVTVGRIPPELKMSALSQV